MSRSVNLFNSSCRHKKCLVSNIYYCHLYSIIYFLVHLPLFTQEFRPLPSLNFFYPVRSNFYTVKSFLNFVRSPKWYSYGPGYLPHKVRPLLGYVSRTPSYTTYVRSLSSLVPYRVSFLTLCSSLLQSSSLP